MAQSHLGERTDKRQESQERLITAATMYHEMGMRFWPDQAEGETEESGGRLP